MNHHFVQFIVELLVPNIMEKSVTVIIGVLLCMRHVTPVLYEEMRKGPLRRSSPQQDSLVANLLQVNSLVLSTN
jgi:hypothetical protein